MTAQDFDPDGVEGAEPWHAFHHAADQLANAGLHLARRLVGESDGEDLRGPGASQAQNMADAGGEHARLAGAGTRQHQERAVKRLDRLALLGVERVEIMAGAPAHGALGGGRRLLVGRRQGCGFERGRANLCHRCENYTIGGVGSEKARNRQKLLGVALGVAPGAEGLRGNGSARLRFNTIYSTNAKRRFRKNAAGKVCKCGCGGARSLPKKSWLGIDREMGDMLQVLKMSVAVLGVGAFAVGAIAPARSRMPADQGHP